jgi:hypothetical protein
LFDLPVRHCAGAKSSDLSKTLLSLWALTPELMTKLGEFEG